MSSAYRSGLHSGSGRAFQPGAGQPSASRAIDYDKLQEKHISIHTDFSPTVNEIIHYMGHRLQSSQYRPTRQGSDRRSDLWNVVIKPCLNDKTSRLLRDNGTTANYVTITGTHGLKLRISDVYSALGYVITETDPYTYSEYGKIEEIQDGMSNAPSTKTKDERSHVERGASTISKRYWTPTEDPA
ncbi:hypothetical protein C8R47DRAFT_1270101 [Mycena vitilis]|nr:hypothetical protein C8R47DRAFT_1270101 [Mycena vitilis]